MADPRFFTRAGPFKIGDIALQIGAQIPAGAAAGSLINDIEDRLSKMIKIIDEEK